MTPEHKKLLEELHNSSYGKALKVYLDEELEKIDTVRGVKSFEEARARELAVDLINKLFAFLKKNQTGGNSKTLYS